MKLRQRLMIEAPVLLALLILTYHRSALWADSLALWQDTAAKSPLKVRPRFQLAFAYSQRQNFPKAVENYEIASRLSPPDYLLLVDWAYSLNRIGRTREAIEKLREATKKESDPQAWAMLGVVYTKQRQFAEALDSLQQAQTLDPNFIMIYLTRGNVYETLGELPQAKEQYQRALELDPYNQVARDALGRVWNR
jgi:tetratricopeptide (TPR) repeat protein